ncbi:MAG: ABC transporter substrate-binding protein [Dehalococcoidia bacterium]|nr:ABC transporter substrate-binding protein [Dehalococcoidia bacterium]
MLLATEPACLDIYTCVNAHWWVAPAYNLLVQRDPQEGIKLFPDLAESWQLSPDGRTFTIHIRKNVKFQDGTLLTADDVAFNVQRIITPLQGDIPQLAWALGPVTEQVNTVDSQTIQVKLKYPFAPFLELFAIDFFPMYSKSFMLEKRGDLRAKPPIGTGPFEYQSYTPGVGARLVRNANYWDSGLPYLDGIQLILVKDRATQKAALRTHSVDLAGRIFESFSPAEVAEIRQQAPAIVFKPSNSSAGVGLYLNTRKKPFDDPRVRQAVYLSIDRGAAVKIIAEGDGLIGGLFSNYPGWGLTQEELGKLPGFRDKTSEREQAKKLLVEAGYPQGFSVSVLARPVPLLQTTAIFVTGQLQSINVRGVVDPQTDAAFYPRALKGDFDVAVGAGANVALDPLMQGRFFVPGGVLNYTGNSDPKLVQLWSQQMSENDIGKRRELIRDIETHVLGQYTFIPIVWPRTYQAHWPNVHDVVIPATDYTGNRLDRIWLSP